MAWMVLAESAGLSSLAFGGLTFMAEGVFGRSSDSNITVWMLKQAKCFGYPGLRTRAELHGELTRRDLFDVRKLLTHHGDRGGPVFGAEQQKRQIRFFFSRRSISTRYFSSSGETNAMASPVAPARPVRPMRWM